MSKIYELFAKSVEFSHHYVLDGPIELKNNTKFLSRNIMFRKTHAQEKVKQVQRVLIFLFFQVHLSRKPQTPAIVSIDSFIDDE